MALALSPFIRQHAKLIRQIPVTIVFGGEEYTGTKTVVALDRLYLDAGRLDEYRFSVKLSQWDFRNGTQPTVKDKITIVGVTYRVLGLMKDAADIDLRLDVGPEFSVG